MSSLSLEISGKYPKDLLERFNLCDPSGDNLEEEEEEEEDDDEEEGGEGMELELGLSLGGKLGVEKRSYSIGAYSFFKSRKKKLKRSSSIAGSIPLPRDDDEFSFEGMAEKKKVAVGGSQTGWLLRTSSLPVETKEEEEEWRKRKEMQWLRRKDAKRRRTQKQLRRIGSGALELERLGVKTQRCGNAQSLQDRMNQEAADSSVTRTNDRTSGAEVDDRSTGTRSILAGGEMPCVSTKGDGPNGRRVHGILYRYCRGKEVRIMCVCHGIFHTPPEFVLHAGGRDVHNPLRHILMNPSGPSF